MCSATHHPSSPQSVSLRSTEILFPIQQTLHSYSVMFFLISTHFIWLSYIHSFPLIYNPPSSHILTLTFPIQHPSIQSFISLYCRSPQLLNLSLFNPAPQTLTSRQMFIPYSVALYVFFHHLFMTLPPHPSLPICPFPTSCHLSNSPYGATSHTFLP